MDWCTVGTEVLKWVVAVLLPVCVTYGVKAIRAWIEAHLHGLWRDWALEIVTQVEAQAKGQLVGAEKETLAVSALKAKGVPQDRAEALVEWAVAQQRETFDIMAQKRAYREAESKHVRRR